jgi:hypothetical protein
MDGVMFQRWLTKQLAPSFEARYPGKKMNLILDNAPYHTTGPDDFLKPSSMAKCKCVDELMKYLNAPDISVEKAAEFGTIHTVRAVKGGERTSNSASGSRRGARRATGVGPAQKKSKSTSRRWSRSTNPSA